MNYRSLFNLGVNIVASVVFGVLLLISIFAGGLKKKTDTIFSILIGFVLTAILSNTLFYSFVVGENTNDNLYMTFSMITLVLLDLSGLVCFIYCTSYFEIVAKRRRFYIFAAVGLCVISIVFKLANTYSHYYLYIKNHRVVTTDYYFTNFIYIMLVFVASLVLAILKRKLRFSERLSFSVFASIPLIATIFHIIFPENSILIFALCAAFLFHYVFYYVERGKIITKQQNELMRQQINIMISQIQPHFIYNCLSSISYLCRTDPKKAELAINDFSDYLRGNLSNLSETKVVPFNKELEFTQNYLKLEKLRFEDRVNVVLDIKANNFSVPSLSLQPIVENAVKHGICKKINGGTVTISTWDDATNNYIKVEDDGIGYDLDAPKKDDERVHVGLANTKERIEKMCHGRVEVNSKINVGTTVLMVIPKAQPKKDK